MKLIKINMHLNNVFNTFTATYNSLVWQSRNPNEETTGIEELIRNLIAKSIIIAYYREKQRRKRILSA